MLGIPTWNSELYFEYHRGVMTTQANHKRNMRESEEQVLNAEKYSSIAWLYGSKYPVAELTEDWKKVLFNQFHDILPGTSFPMVYQDVFDDYRAADEILLPAKLDFLSLPALEKTRVFVKHANETRGKALKIERVSELMLGAD